MAACFPELLRWVRELWTPCEEEAEPEPPQILALNSTHHQGKWVALVVGVAYHQHALPVAWHVVAAHARESWTGHFCRLLRQLAPAVPDRTPVHVLCDRGAGQPGPVATDCGSGLASGPALSVPHRLPPDQRHPDPGTAR